ncbi:MAG: hypothetical protein ACR2KB_13335 [Chitinophagaceae bacterium]
MKNLIKYFVIISITCSCSLSSYGQATSSGLGNFPLTPGVDYLGWAFGVNLDLNIKNEDAMPINFYTNAGAGSLNNLRMMIDGNNGFVGLNHSNPPGIDLSKKCV